MRNFGEQPEGEEEKEYMALLAECYKQFSDRTYMVCSNSGITDYFLVLLDASAWALTDILYLDLREPGLRKHVQRNDINCWFHKASLAMMAYSYYFYGDGPIIESDPIYETYQIYWQNKYKAFSRVFNEIVDQKQIDYYAAGLREDVYKGFSKIMAEGDTEKRSEAFNKSWELDNKDYVTIGSDLLKEIWHEDLSDKGRDELNNYKVGNGRVLSLESKKTMFIGLKIWKAYEQIVQPYLKAWLTED